jgi:serralysin
VHLHELTHALGLKEAHLARNGFPALPAAWDSLEFTVATYRSYVGAGTERYTNEALRYPQGFMMLDIAALQHLYGADFTTSAGDTTYRWNPATGQMSVDGVGQGMPGANRIFLTIWDGGGRDTYDFSAYATGVGVDLSPGGCSVTAAAQLAVLEPGDADRPRVLARGNVFNALPYHGDARS